ADDGEGELGSELLSTETAEALTPTADPAAHGDGGRSDRNAGGVAPRYAGFAAPRSPNEDSIFRRAGTAAVKLPTTANVESKSSRWVLKKKSSTTVTAAKNGTR